MIIIEKSLQSNNTPINAAYHDRHGHTGHFPSGKMCGIADHRSVPSLTPLDPSEPLHRIGEGQHRALVGIRSVLVKERRDQREHLV
jgi:hypothetical protein